MRDISNNSSTIKYNFGALVLGEGEMASGSRGKIKLFSCTFCQRKTTLYYSEGKGCTSLKEASDDIQTNHIN